MPARLVLVGQTGITVDFSEFWLEQISRLCAIDIEEEERGKNGTLSLLPTLPPSPSSFSSFIPFFQVGAGNPDINFEVPIIHTLCVWAMCTSSLGRGIFFLAERTHRRRLYACIIPILRVMRNEEMHMCSGKWIYPKPVFWKKNVMKSRWIFSLTWPWDGCPGKRIASMMGSSPPLSFLLNFLLNVQLTLQLHTYFCTGLYFFSEWRRPKDL